MLIDQLALTAGLSVRRPFTGEPEMAVLHHAFRCTVTPALERDILELLAKWEAGDRDDLSALAAARYEALGEREDMHAAFYFAPDGAVSSWLQPQLISPGLAALVTVAKDLVPLPSLSASHDTNHHLLATHLPALGWSIEETDYLVHGQPIESMLQRYTRSADQPKPGQFRHTGGWTPPEMVRRLSPALDRLASGPPLHAGEAARAAWNLLNKTGALADARAMMTSLKNDDWLVMAVTH